MLKGTPFLVLVIFLTNVTLSQNLKVTYSVLINDIEDFAPKNSKTEDILEFKKYISGLKERTSNIEIIVNCNNVREYNISTEIGMSIDESFMFNMDLKMLGLSTFIQGNSIVSYGFDDNRGFTIEYDYNQLFSWEITNEVKNILGYKCTKAVIKYKDKSLYTNTTPREFWFTNELNFNGGPSLFSGLPGPILQIKTPITTITASQIESHENVLKKEKIDFENTKTYKEAQIYFKKGAEAVRSRM
ncbi:GLPGLI family protein [uncultured Nonlabens sp.]|uniref:GLPGLI family protein n=1 Tax=uncultured Nonlabens sp. TaxID=859306 RepID=UPI00262A95A1|nr:GLPGLI family protein [uncultured Nonlabens sp.]